MKIIKSVALDEELISKLEKQIPTNPYIKPNLSALMNALLKKYLEEQRP